VFAVAMLSGGIWFAVLRNDNPAPVSLNTATQGVSVGTGGKVATTSVRSSSGTPTGTSSGAGATTSAVGPRAASTVADGQRWSVDTTVTSASGGNYGGFRIEEVLSGVGSTTAVGRSPGVSGSLTFDGATLMSGSFTVDFTNLTTDKTQRDRRMAQALETSKHPNGTFTVSGPVSLTSAPNEGATVSVDVPGSFTIHGVTKATTVRVDATVTNGVLAVVGSSPITFADYGIVVPSAPVVVSVEDHGIIEFQLYLTAD